MIVEVLARIVSLIAQGIAALFGDFPAPGWLENASGTWQGAMGVVAGLDPWIPWAVLSTVVAAVFACLVTGFGIKVVRMVLSLFTGGGGSAA